MATFTWTTKTGGTWSVPANWSPSGPPGSSDTALIGNLGGSNYNVTVSTSTTIAQLDIGTTTGGGAPSLIIGSAQLTMGTLDYTTASGGNATAITINAGGILDITSSITDTGGVSETITVSGKTTGGHLELGSLSVVNAKVTDTFSNNSATTLNTGIIEYLSGFTSGSSTSQAITNVAWGDEFIIDGANFTGDTATLSGGVLTVKNGGGTTVFTMNSVARQLGSSATFVVNGSVIAAVCYARGTMIRTPDGEVAVEKLRAGKPVTIVQDGEQLARQVRWLGHRRIDLTKHPRPETVAPIRIQAGAFADCMPHRDLVVSPDHAIFVDGKLICARQLVNGTTIRQETNWTAVDYYHVELDHHAILLAEGLSAESYIDTGNAGFFANSDAPLVLRPDLTDESAYPTREAGSCAPFVWDEANVQPVWQHLADRAAALGRPVPARETTVDSGLRLAAKGRSIKPIYGTADLAIFALPRGASEVRLVSRAASPTDTRPWMEDRRRLGVRVARLVLRSADEVREIPVDHPELAKGWWAVERDGLAMSRWTDGEAVLPLPATHGDVMLEVHLAGAMTYLVEAAPSGEAGRRAA
jgi:Hint domain